MQSLVVAIAVVTVSGRKQALPVPLAAHPHQVGPHLSPVHLPGAVLLPTL